MRDQNPGLFARVASKKRPSLKAAKAKEELQKKDDPNRSSKT